MKDENLTTHNASGQDGGLHGVVFLVRLSEDVEGQNF